MNRRGFLALAPGIFVPAASHAAGILNVLLGAGSQSTAAAYVLGTGSVLGTNPFRNGYEDYSPFGGDTNGTLNVTSFKDATIREITSVWDAVPAPIYRIFVVMSGTRAQSYWSRMFGTDQHGNYFAALSSDATEYSTFNLSGVPHTRWGFANTVGPTSLPLAGTPAATYSIQITG